MAGAASTVQPSTPPSATELRGGTSPAAPAAAQLPGIYRQMSAAQRAVDARPDDVNGWLMLCEGGAALGIVTPIRRAVSAAPLAAEVQRGLLARLGSVESRISWSQLATQFDANLAALALREAAVGGPQFVDDIRAAWRESVGKLELYRGRDGATQIAVRNAPVGQMWLPGLAPHNRLVDAATLRSQWNGRIIRTLAIHGIGLGDFALDAIRASRQTFLQFSPLVALIEPTALAWAVALHLHDWRDVLRESRVRICAGTGAYAQFDEILGDIDRHVPVLLRGGPAWPGECQDSELAVRVKDAETKRAQRQASHPILARDAAGEADSADWGGRLAAAARGERTLSVLGVTSRFTTVLQYAMRDWLFAFERAGHRTEVVIEPDDHAHFSPLRVQDAIERVEPDVILLIDHLQYEYDALFPTRIPAVCWIQDNLPHLFRPEAGRGVRPLEFVIGNGFEECVGRFGFPAARFLPARIPTNPAKLCDATETEDDLAPYRCDVMYCTNVVTSFDERLARCRKQYFGDAGAFFARAFEMLEADMRHPWFDGHYNIDALVRRTESELGLECRDPALRNSMTNELLSLADQRLREDSVRAAARWADETGSRFHLYGLGWESRAEFAKFARGPVEHGLPLGRAFRAAKIALHVGVNSALHQRVLDGLAAGGFMLIQDKLSDTAYALNAGLVRWYEERRPATPFNLCAADLPPPLDDWVRRLRYWGGLTPEGSVTVREPDIDWWYQLVQANTETPSAVWPDFMQVQFHGAAGLAERIAYFLSHDEERREIAARMRSAVVERFTYDALVRETLRFMADRLRSGDAGR